MKLISKCLPWLLALAMGTLDARTASLEQQFVHPPDSARPWVYWFWNNGNVTKAGITADLEAMKRVGIGGVIIMDVVERFAPPRGPATFMGARWRELFCFAVSEARRLGLQVDMTNGPGWCGSSGPWITPALSMQMLVCTNLVVAGPTNFSAVLPRPPLPRRSPDYLQSAGTNDYYRDVAVLAYPETPGGMAPLKEVMDLTAKMGPGGKLNWAAPPGRWVIERIGHTSTGATSHPPVVGGNGLECDKLNSEAMDAQFAGMMARLIAEVGPDAGTALVATHIDSWEVGSQNWTPDLRREFLKRRGYDPLPWLPCVAAPGQGATAFDNAEMTRRFRWDFAQTISELLAQNYSGRLAQLAREHGLRLTLEGYDLPFGDEATYTARADEPMSEFWMNTPWAQKVTEFKGREMASVGHVMGRKVIGAEAFTSDDHERWMQYPATIKSLGDFEFCQGINHFIIHRYAHQPYLDRFPGVTMGPWGLHYERTETWWEMSRPWHEYLTRCQFLLRQGLFVADLCYLRPQLPNQTYFTPRPAVPGGHKYDECSAEALLARMSVKEGRLVLPDGMSYRMLVLPERDTRMTPALVSKIEELVAGGATVYGPRPTASPSLQDYPRCDEAVARMAAEVWGDCDGKRVTEHAFGKGRVIWGEPLESVLARMQAGPDFRAIPKLNWIHRRVGGRDVYFVANPAPASVQAECTFRTRGLCPEIWDPETGGISPVAVYEETGEGTVVPLRFEPSGSMFVMFRPEAKAVDNVVSFTRNGRPALPPTLPPAITIRRAIYGVLADPRRTRDVRAKVQALADRGQTRFPVSQMAAGDDPAFGIVKTLVVEYAIDGRAYTNRAQDPDIMSLAGPWLSSPRTAEVRCGAARRLSLEVWKPGRYELTTASGRRLSADVASVPAPFEIPGPWEVDFPPHWGAPAKITLERLVSLSDSPIEGVKYFSGTATYLKTFDWNPAPAQRDQKSQYWLDLGEVQVMARVKLNGRDLGVLWKRPFRTEITRVLRRGQNTIEIQVADLWPNRMIGDAALPSNARFTWSSWEPFTKDSPLPKSGLIGPVSIRTVETIPLD